MKDYWSQENKWGDENKDDNKEDNFVINTLQDDLILCFDNFNDS